MHKLICFNIIIKESVPINLNFSQHLEYIAQ